MVVGSSAGGLAALKELRNRPGLTSRYSCIDPIWFVGAVRTHAGVLPWCLGNQGVARVGG